MRTTALVALLAAALLTALPAAAGASRSTKRVAREAHNDSLGATILTTTKGRTLYSLSVETNGRFVCTGSCLSSWHPLLVPAGVNPTGPVKLGTIERPEGKTQVTFKGRPLYSFSGDSKPGDVNGEDVMDVGTWHAATVSKAAPQPQPEPAYPY